MLYIKYVHGTFKLYNKKSLFHQNFRNYMLLLIQKRCKWLKSLTSLTMKAFKNTIVHTINFLIAIVTPKKLKEYLNEAEVQLQQHLNFCRQ